MCKKKSVKDVSVKQTAFFHYRDKCVIAYLQTCLMGWKILLNVFQIKFRVNKSQSSSRSARVASGMHGRSTITRVGAFRTLHITVHRRFFFFFFIQSDSSFIKLHTDNTRHVCANDIVTSNSRRQKRLRIKLILFLYAFRIENRSRVFVKILHYF